MKNSILVACVVGPVATATLVAGCHEGEAPPAEGIAATESTCLEVTDDIRSDVVWSKRPVVGDAGTERVPDICVRRPVIIQRQALLRIAPGVRVVFDPGTALVVARAEGAALVSEGTAEEPIVLEGSTDAEGVWDGVEIASGDTRNRVAFTTIRGAGAGGKVVADDTLGGLNAALVLDAEPGAPARAHIQDVTFERSAGWGLVVEWISEATGLVRNRFVRNTQGAQVLSPHNVTRVDATTTYADNGFDGVAVTGTPDLEASTDTVWQPLAAGARYWIREPLAVLSNFTIEPGTELVFAPGTSLSFPQNTTNTRAEVRILGTADAKVSMHGEQTTAGSWEGIEIATGHTTNRVQHAEIAHAKVGLRLRRSGAFPAAALEVSDSHLRDNRACGIETTHADNMLVTTNVTFANNGNDLCEP